MGNYKFSAEQLRFLENKRGAKWWIKHIILNLFITLVLAVGYYFILSLFFSTDEEKEIKRENDLIAQEYEELQDKVGILENTVNNLRIKDEEIYKSIFNANPPELSSNSDKDNYNTINAFDTISNMSIVWKSNLELIEAENNVNINKNLISDINNNINLAGVKIINIPSIIPIKDFTINQIGASVGKKVNPFYKTVVDHKGIDLIGNIGTEVIAPADGVVIKAIRQSRNEGNLIEINHNNGYLTKYMTLGDVLVAKGAKVKQGDVIGRIGLSGMSFAPHLHYEVWFKEKPIDPINYFFGDITPNIYKEMIVISSNTGQSLD
jgi:Membrane proteins related to metalloendopeptidases